MPRVFQTALQDQPPRARLAFRVGTVGHRPDRLKQADIILLANVLLEALVVVKETVEEFPEHDSNAGLFTDEAPLLRSVSPLAEGSDTLFVEQASSLGYALCCPMPFSQKKI